MLPKKLGSPSIIFLKDFTIAEIMRSFILGLFDPNHLPPDPFAKTTTMAFVCFSMIIIPTTMIPPILLYHCPNLNILFIVMALISALWRGATYYIHIFSQRYNTKFNVVDLKQEHNDESHAKKE